MVKKIVLGTLCIGFIGVLIYGAILRTNAKTSSSSTNRAGGGAGRGRTITAGEADAAYDREQSQGRGQAARATAELPAGTAELIPAPDAAVARVAGWQAVEGAVISVGAEEMIVELADGREVLVEGHPWAYAQSQAFSPQVGHHLAMTIFEEDGELKPGQMNDLSSGQTVTLRLEDGQPLWSTGPQNVQNSAGETGLGRGQGGTGRGQGGAVSEQAGTGMYTAAARLTFEGIATTANDGELVIAANTGESVVVEGRAWAHALEHGFMAQAQHSVIVTGFVEDGEFKAISLQNQTTGQVVAVRDADGRPLWSGGTRGGA